MLAISTPYDDIAIVLVVCVLTAIAYPISRFVWFRFGRIAGVVVFPVVIVALTVLLCGVLHLSGF